MTKKTATKKTSKKKSSTKGSTKGDIITFIEDLGGSEVSTTGLSGHASSGPQGLIGFKSTCLVAGTTVEGLGSTAKESLIALSGAVRCIAAMHRGSGASDTVAGAPGATEGAEDDANAAPLEPAQ